MERIHQEMLLRAPPAKVYAALTNAGQFSSMTGGAPAEIEPNSGGMFSCFGGMILGRNVECAPGERLVQAWRGELWEPGQYSIVRFELKAEGDGTRVLLDHAGFPEGQGDHLAAGWHTNYWEPLKKLFTA